MIEIEIIKSPDINRLGMILLHKNEISFGAHISRDIILENSKLDQAGVLEVTADKQSYFSPKGDLDFHINRNKTNAKKIVKVGDIIDLLGTSFKIKKLDFVPIQDMGDILNERLELMKSEKSPFLKVLKEIKK